MSIEATKVCYFRLALSGISSQPIRLSRCFKLKKHKNYFEFWPKVLLANYFAGFCTFDLFDLLILIPGVHCYIALVILMIKYNKYQEWVILFNKRNDNCNRLFDNCFVLYIYILADNFDFTQSLKTEVLKISFFYSSLENYEFDLWGFSHYQVLHLQLQFI